MDEIKEMLKAVINSQHALKSDLMRRISESEAKIERVHQEIKAGFDQVNRRLDMQGKQLAYLEEDALN